MGCYNGRVMGGVRGELTELRLSAALASSALILSAALACSPSVREAQPAEAHGEAGKRGAASQVDPSREDERGAVKSSLNGTPASGKNSSPANATAESASVNTVSQVPLVARPLERLEPFYASLDALRRGEQSSPVRVLWLGDSHTAADFMTHQVRLRLQDVAGDGGAGFVRLGLKGYRHSVVRLESKGTWRKAPILPAQRTRVLDGVFGYGGIRTLPAAGATATVRFRHPDPVGFAQEASPGTSAAGVLTPSKDSVAKEDSARATSAEVKWTVSYRLGKGGGLQLLLGDERTLAETVPSEAPGGLQHTSLLGPADAALTVAHHSGSPQVFGVFAERVSPGVVFDTVGINGARAATPLAWSPEQFAGEIERRSLDLLILAFGTNEAFDRTAVHRYAGHFEELIARIRRGAPDLPCWVVGPPDSAGDQRSSRKRVLEITAVQREAAKQAGCAFSSGFELMGGNGSFYRWQAEKPALARGDGIHLTIAGYKKLGDLIADALLGAPTAESSTAESSTAE